jgi:hypothetical protein
MRSGGRSVNDLPGPRCGGVARNEVPLAPDPTTLTSPTFDNR